MSKRTRGFAAVLVGLALLLCILAFWFARTRPPSEPSYQGRPLHAWLEAIDELRFRGEVGKGVELEVTNDAVSAVLAIGATAVPWLRHELSARAVSAKVKVRELTSHLPRYRFRPSNSQLLIPSLPCQSH